MVGGALYSVVPMDTSTAPNSDSHNKCLSMGWSAHIRSFFVGASWEGSLKSQHLHFLEPLAVTYTLLWFKNVVASHSVSPLLDNTMALCCINWPGGTVSRKAVHPSTGDLGPLHTIEHFSNSYEPTRNSQHKGVSLQNFC